MKIDHKWNHPPNAADERECKRCGQLEWCATKTICPDQLRALIRTGCEDALSIPDIRHRKVFIDWLATLEALLSTPSDAKGDSIAQL